ncbi:Cytochrome subunit of sulfide dehydrogenase [Candidatus Terasakiella magnetica]|uniref:Cytochrome subunit of sulfide dehydrogenase n=2 Tax=Candidatus Terasakiella magnetica TaxID=1867952 RepID=A0A1C3RJJ7_9PROT|nr:Cytochrome subunit of sulfide dehydrogenase [Candidatus Terasakiella magnetica]
MASYSTDASAGMASAETLAAPCAGCHGTNGSSHGPATPTIAGITQEYFMSSMKDYVSGERKSTVMDRIAKGYSEEEMKVMADYFAAQKIVRYKQDVDAELAKKGRALFQNYCEKCHEEDGYLADGIGVMAGQTMDYLRFMVADFFTGDREWSKKQKKKMKALMDDHGQEGYEAVIHYAGSKM